MNGLPCLALPFSVLLPQAPERSHNTYPRSPVPIGIGLASPGEGWVIADSHSTFYHPTDILHFRYQEISQSIRKLFSKLLSHFSKCFLEVFKEVHWGIRSYNIGKIELMEYGKQQGSLADQQVM